MKKRLFLAILAMASFIGSYAYEIGEYAYTASQRLKIVGENLVQNGNFAEGTNGWYGANGTEAVNANVWQVTDAMGPNGETVIESLGATADEPFCNTWTLPGGMTYIVSFQVKAPAYANSTVGTTVGNNYADFFLNTTGSIAHVASTEEAPVVNVATSFAMETEWKDVAFVFTPEEGQVFVMHFERFAAGTQFTNIEIHEAMEVYDDRIVRRKVAFADQILADPNFNESTDAQAAREEFYNGVYAYVVAGLNGEEGGANFDDIADAESTLEQFMEGLSTYMDASTDNLATEANFKYVTDLTAMPKYNRKSIKANTTYGGFMFRMDGVATGGETNWQHALGGEFVQQMLQGSYANGAGSMALYNTNLPKGKYYVAGEVRVAAVDKNYNYIYNLEKNVKIFIGSDTLDCGTIVGEDFVKFYTVAELKAGETFEAGFWWEGNKTGSSFQCKNFECRSFGDVMDEAERKVAWDKFIVQYNAVVNARKTVVELLNTPDYPWQKDSLARALELWDPYYNDIVAKGWVAEDGSDTRVATNEELADWADYQGVEMYDSEDNLLKLQLVRGYLFASNYVKSLNRVFDDLRDEIFMAESIRDDDMNQLGDKATFQAAIDAAQNTLTTTLAITTDATMQADSLTLVAAIVTLKEAETIYINSGALEPFVDIDFSNNFEPVYDPEQTLSAYVIKGAAGQMEFPTNAVSFDEATQTYLTTGITFGIGCLSNDELLCPGMLRVGRGEAAVNLEAVAEDEVLRVHFDLYVGNLINRNIYIDLRNENNERVAGFSLGRYSGVVSYNEFNNDDNTGLDILKYVTGVGSSSASNDAIAAEKNKSSFDLIIDYKAKAIKGIVTNGTNGTCEGAWIPMPQLGDTKIVKFVLGSTYDNEGRRCWFDNLKIMKYKSSSSSPETPDTEFIKNIGFDKDLTFQADGSMKEAITTDTSLSDRSWAYIAADNTVYARPKNTSSQSRPDGRKMEAVNGFQGQIDGWTLVSGSQFPKCEWTYFGSVPYALGETAVPIADDGSTYLTVPARPTEFDGGEGCLYLRAGWGNSASYKQEVELPCAKYRLEYWTININPNASALATDLSKITCRNDVFKDESGIGLNATEWTKHEFEFTPTTRFTMEFGFKAANSGSGSNPIVCIDGIKLYKIGESDTDEIKQSLIYECEDLAGQAAAAGYSGLSGQIGDYGFMIEEIDTSDKDAFAKAIEMVDIQMAKFRAAIDEMPNVDAILVKMDSIMTATDFDGNAEFQAAFVKILNYKEGYYTGEEDFATWILGAVEEANTAINAYYNGDSLLKLELENMISQAENVIAGLTYQNVPGRSDLDKYIASARELLAAENVEEWQLNDMINIIRNYMNAVSNMNRMYRDFAGALTDLTNLINENTEAEESLKQEATAFVTESRQGLENGIYSENDFQMLWNQYDRYARQLSMLFVNVELTQPGELRAQLDNRQIDIYSVGGLRVSGPLNWDDMNCIREMWNLASLDMGNADLTEVGDWDLAWKDQLTDVVLPQTLYYMPGYAFRDCYNLTKITLNAMAPPVLYDYVMGGMDNQCTLVVPSLAVESYKSASYWNRFQIVGNEILPETITIANRATISWPDTLDSNYKPNVNLTMGDRGDNYWEGERYTYGALTLRGNATLSAKDFQMFFDPAMAQYGNMENRNSAVLINQGNMRADSVSLKMRINSSRWYFLSVPFDSKVSDITTDYDVPYVIYKYDGQKRANADMSNTWTRMAADSVLNAGQGYILQCSFYRDANGNNTNTITFTMRAINNASKNKIFSNSTVEVPMSEYLSELPQNRSWNLIGNPYPCYYNSRFMNIEAPFTVWNVSSQNYEAYSPVDDEYVFMPGESFFFQRPLEQSSISFDQAGRLLSRDIYATADGYARISKRGTNAQRSVYNLTLTGNERSDRTRFVINEDAKTGYETDKDAAKFAAMDPRAPQLYTIDNGVRYAINERPAANGIIKLGVSVAEAGTYTLAVAANANEDVRLKDLQTNVDVVLDEQGYTFEAEAGTIENRFEIHLGGGEVTGISVAKTTGDDNLFDLQGRRVSSPRKGLYINNGKKIVVK